MTDWKEILWAQGSASGARSWAYHGVGKVHYLNPEKPYLTLCGRGIPKAWKRLTPDKTDARCKLCLRKAQHSEIVEAAQLNIVGGRNTVGAL